MRSRDTWVSALLSETRVPACTASVSLSRDCCYSGHRSLVTSHRSLSRRPWPHERGEASVGPASHTASVTPQAAPQSTLLRIMLLKSALSQTGSRGNVPAPMARWLLLLSGITCIILATVAPQTIKQEMKIIGSSQYLDWWNTFSLTQGIAELQFNV